MKNRTDLREISKFISSYQAEPIALFLIPADENNEGSRNVGFLSVHPPDAAGSPMKFYGIDFALKAMDCEYIL